MVVNYGAQIEAIRTALAQGVMSVSYEGKTATYRSFDEMLKTISYLERQQAKAEGRPAKTVGLASFDRGYSHRGYRY